jgi:hypothetical protein
LVSELTFSSLRRGLAAAELEKVLHCKPYIVVQERIFVMPMQRNEAVTYLKELLNACSNMSPQAVSFESNTNSQSTDYRVHIKGPIYDSDKQMVKEIAKKHSLTVKEDSDEVIIYRP